MCGIVGVVGDNDPHNIQIMNLSQFHRGPDEGGIYNDTNNAINVSLGMRRLSIIDLQGGHQPMIDRVRDRIIVFNGEIFNAKILREKLKDDGYRFFTENSDTEVLLYLYDKYKSTMVNMLNGMFSFVIYDKNEKLLYGARDRCGIKPFYYYNNGGMFIFSSELKTILKHPRVKTVLNIQSLHHYLSFQFVPAENSIIDGVKKLGAGCAFSYNINKNVYKENRYWRLQDQPIIDDKPIEIIRDELSGKLTQALDLWSTSDVQIGCSLSSGIDSSIIVGRLSEMGHKLKTWTLGFSETFDSDFDERILARSVSKKWNTDHHEIVISASDVLNDLDKMIYSLDEPYAGGLPSWYVFKDMSKEVKVAHTGTGGDELFGNYGKWRPYKYMSRDWLATYRSHLKKHGFLESIMNPHGFLYHIYFGEKDKKKIMFQHDKMISSSSLIERYWQECKSTDVKQKIPYVDFNLQLPEEFLRMTDRFSMAWSLEARTPFLDHDFIEYVLSINPEIRYSSTNMKKLLLDTFSYLLPKEIIKKKKKGFVLPVRNWLKHEMKDVVHGFLGKEYLRKQNLFKEDVYTNLVIPHMKGVKDHSWQLWTLLMFQLWYDKYIS